MVLSKELGVCFGTDSGVRERKPSLCWGRAHRFQQSCRHSDDTSRYDDFVIGVSLSDLRVNSCADLWVFVHGNTV